MWHKFCSNLPHVHIPSKMCQHLLCDSPTMLQPSLIVFHLSPWRTECTFSAFTCPTLQCSRSSTKVWPSIKHGHHSNVCVLLVASLFFKHFISLNSSFLKVKAKSFATNCLFLQVCHVSCYNHYSMYSTQAHLNIHCTNTQHSITVTPAH